MQAFFMPETFESRRVFSRSAGCERRGLHAQCDRDESDIRLRGRLSTGGTCRALAGADILRGNAFRCVSFILRVCVFNE